MLKKKLKQSFACRAIKDFTIDIEGHKFYKDYSQCYFFFWRQFGCINRIVNAE